jgi:hypothetical protein
MVKLRCIRHADILKRAYLCQVNDTASSFFLDQIQPFGRKATDSAGILCNFLSIWIICFNGLQ